MGLSTLLASFFVLGFVVAAFLLLEWRRQHRETRDGRTLAQMLRDGASIPPTLHPHIDRDKCLGCMSCMSVCPEGDVLGLIGGVAQLIRPAQCIGHGRCALECPSGALRLVFGTRERGIDLPELDERCESSRPGVFIVGELAGMGLIASAARQGVEAARALAEDLSADAPGTGVDVAIVGAGPAGLATALGCKKAGVSFRVLEQSELGGAITRYPRQKLVMTRRIDLPLYGKFGKPLMLKEDLLAAWHHVVARTGISVEERIQILDLEGERGRFSLRTDRGIIAARRVVLATGLRGTPRKLEVPGEELPKVTHELIDPSQYRKKRVLVVGGGDAAIEAALALAEEAGTEVSLSYRRQSLSRCRDANRRKFQEAVTRGAIHAFFGSQVLSIEPDAVELEVAGRRALLANDFVIACIGGELPVDLLNRLGIPIRRFSGEPLARHPGQCSTRAGEKPSNATEDEKQERFRRRLAFVLAGVAFITLAALSVVGRDYYGLPIAQRLRAPQHSWLRPAGLWGHGIGVIATGFMLSNFLYSVRKRVRWLKGNSSIRTWLTFHMFVGLMSPALIAFHAAFRINNFVASTTALALAIVVGTGFLGRFLYGMVPSEAGKALDLAAVVARWKHVRADLGPMLRSNTCSQQVRTLVEEITLSPKAHSLGVFLVFKPVQWVWLQILLLRAWPAFGSWRAYLDFRRTVDRAVKVRAQVEFNRGLKRLLSFWRVAHIILAIVLLVTILLHVAISYFLGYRWILS